MAKLEGFSKVAVVNYGGYSDYHFAIYEDGVDYQVGDMVLHLRRLRKLLM